MEPRDTLEQSDALSPESCPLRGRTRRRKDRVPSKIRDKVSNGTRMLPETDGRLRTARRYKEIASAILVDQGGDACSEARLQLIRRFSAAAVIAEELEARLVRGEAIDIAEHALLCSSLVRLAARIGLGRIPKQIGTLAEYLTKRYSQPPCIDDAAEDAS
jgi:hypothetical protein